MSASAHVTGLLAQMHRDGRRLTVRSITRRLAEAGWRVRVCRRATAAEVLQTWQDGKTVIVPNRSVMSIGVGSDTQWDATSLQDETGLCMERLRLGTLLLDWKPRGTVIICDL